VCLLAACTPPEAELTSLSLAPGNPRVARGEAVQFVATAFFSTGEVRDVTASTVWTVDDAQVGLADDAEPGLVRALVEGRTLVRGQYGGLMRSRPLEVSQAETRSLELDPPQVLVPMGLVVPVRVLARSSDGAVEDVTAEAAWAVSNEALVSIEAGVLTPRRPGTLTLTVSARNLTAEAAVTVTDATVVSVEVQPALASVAAGLTQRFTATALLTDGARLDVTHTAGWTTTPAALATVAADGQATTLAPGQVAVSALVAGQRGSARLDVTPALLTSLAVHATPATLPAGLRATLTALATATDGSTRDVSAGVSWTSGDVTRLVVENGAARALAPGRVTLTAALGSLSATTEVVVTAPVLTRLELLAAPATLPLGATQALHAQAHWSDGTSTDVTASASWTVVDPAVAQVSGGGLLTALAPGQTVVTASHAGQSATSPLTVTSAALWRLELSPPSPRLAAGTSLQLTVTGVWSTGGSQALAADACAWRSDDGAVVQVSNAPGQRGLATAGRAGQARVTATCLGLQGQLVVSVHDSALAELVLTPFRPSAPAGFGRHLVATGVFVDGSTQDLTALATWQSSEPGVAAVQAGLVSALRPGVAALSATALGVTGHTTFTVTAATLQALDVGPASTVTPVGVAVSLTATGHFSDGRVVDVTAEATWSSSEPGIASVALPGRVSALRQGVVDLTASLGGLSGTARLTVTAAVLAQLTVTPGTATLPRGRAADFVAQGTFTDGSQADLTTGVTWSTGDGFIARASNIAGSPGQVAALAVGTTTVIAQLGAHVGTATLTVTAAAPVSLSLSPASTSLPLGAHQQLTATALFTDGSLADVTAEASFSGSAPAVLGVAPGGEAVALALGSAVVTARWQAFVATSQVTVTAAQLLQVWLTPGAVTLPLGVTRAFKVWGGYSDGVTRELTSGAWWRSAQPGVLTVSNAASSRGFITTVAVGQGTLTAEVDGRVAQATLTVSQGALVRLDLLPAAGSTALGFTRSFIALGWFADGTSQVVTSAVTWASSDEQVAAISSAGLLSTLGPGLTIVTASRDGVSAQVTHVVTPAVLVDLRVSAPPQLSPGASQALVAEGTWSDGTLSDVTALATWATSTPGVLRLDGGGLITALAPGDGRVEATLDGRSSSVTVTVR
jgi:hypothetical protein